MLKTTVVGLPLLILMSACGGGADAPSAEGVVALTGARLIDGNDGAPIENSVVLIRGERIESVGAVGTLPIPEGAEVIDLGGKTIMPALIDLHIHLALVRDFEDSAHNFDEENIREKLDQYARYGVLHVVSQGSDKPLVFEIRERQRAGDFPGARIYTAGRGFGVVGGYPYPQPDITPELDAYRPTSPEEAITAVHELAAQQVDFVKLSVDHRHGALERFSPEIYRAIIEESRDLGLASVAHIYTLEDARGLVDAGIDGLVHSVRDLPVDSALIDRMRARDVFLVPTLVREEVNFIYAGRAPLPGRPVLHRAPPSLGDRETRERGIPGGATRSTGSSGVGARSRNGHAQPQDPLRRRRHDRIRQRFGTGRPLGGILRAS
jgi:imidazolonepropionase-like amidohydrolase